ncbi:DEKNAAC102499 [Brettanomyces naardenensis]|uniref:DEKNAAC102499 n=1 Tax=Brettanomyces naardenensis TaxID=13370 RepID=A0A448YL55_BRENA|nr:DEKNAAC102499 [Brettanomyces naardenensis]
MHPLPTNDEEKREYTQRLENRLQHLRIVRELSRNPDLIQTRSWESFNTISKLPLEDQDEPTGTIRDPLTEAGGIPIPPLVFNDPQNKKAYVIMHLGRRLSGYPLIVHGGIIGLLVDEVFKKSCAAEFGILDVNRLHTERSTLNYRSPTFVNTFVLFETQCYDLGGGRYRVVGKLSNAQNRKKLAEAETIITQGPLPTWPAGPVIETVEEKPESKGWGLWAR